MGTLVIQLANASLEPPRVTISRLQSTLSGILA